MTVAVKSNDVARETLRQLALRRVAPTPENYRRVYCEIAGKSEEDPTAALEKTLIHLAAELPRGTSQLAHASHAFSAAVSARRWEPACLALTDVMRELAANARPTDRAAVVAHNSGPDASTELRELLAQTLDLGIAALIPDAPALAGDARALAQRLRDPAAMPSAALCAQLKSLWEAIGKIHGSQHDRLQQGLLELLRLLVENISELVADDQWLRGQMAIVMQVISGPPTLEVIAEAKHNLKEAIVKQGLLKQGLVEAKTTIKQMAASLVEQIGTIASATGEYHDKIETLSQQISQTEDMSGLSKLLDEVMRESRHVQESALRSRDEVLQARQKVDAAENKIRELEHELENASEKVREDYLTGTMNRRGMNEAFERELAISDRNDRPLSVALLDIDNFKEFNDTLGHQAGDDALVHLSQVIKETVRPGDIVARFGGEEFLLLMPNSDSYDAINVVARLQRELTKRFFLHNNRKLLITFSAGVARRAPGEAQNAVIQRADAALYEAKRAGKNRVIAAP